MKTYLLYLVSFLYFSRVKGAVKGKQPNIVFILADDYGYNDIGYHGSEIETPNMDKLALEGVKLENYYVQPICTPTRSQFMSGRYQIHTGLQHGIVWPAQRNGLPLNMPTVANKLSESGYATHMVGKWHLGMYEKECTPLYRGFDTYYGYLTGSENYTSHIRCGSAFPGWKEGDHWCGLDLRDGMDPVTNQNGTYSTHLFAKRAEGIIAEHNPDKPMFLYLAFQAVHSPLQVPEEYLKKYDFIHNRNRKIYAGMVSAMDEAVGNVTNSLKSAGLWNNTILVFSTDNGGQVIEGGNNWPLRGWKGSLWEGGMKANGFVVSPLLEKRGYTNHELIHVTDWFPTFISLARGEGTPGLDGYNQWNTISQGTTSPRIEILHNIDPLFRPRGKPLYNGTFNTATRAAIRAGYWKLITGNPGNGSWVPPPTLSGNVKLPLDDSENVSKNVWLFNIAVDPNEYNDLSEQHPDIVKLLLTRLKKYNESSVPVRYPAPDPDADPSTLGGVWGPWVQDRWSLIANFKTRWNSAIENMNMKWVRIRGHFEIISTRLSSKLQEYFTGNTIL